MYDPIVKTITDGCTYIYFRMDKHDFDNESTITTVIITITKMKPDYDCPSSAESIYIICSYVFVYEFLFAI